ncbi:superantigen-like protein SSL10, partial [Staphylococcus aureus]|nr:superantigen-like protein SSL10 [Staphylococcus aureus]
LKHGKSNLRFKFRRIKIQVLLPRNDKSKFQQGSYEGLDVFFVQEKRDKDDIFYTVGGVIQNNKPSGVVSAAILNIS